MAEKKKRVSGGAGLASRGMAAIWVPLPVADKEDVAEAAYQTRQSVAKLAGAALVNAARKILGKNK